MPRLAVDIESTKPRVGTMAATVARDTRARNDAMHYLEAHGTQASREGLIAEMSHIASEENGAAVLRHFERLTSGR